MVIFTRKNSLGIVHLNRLVFAYKKKELHKTDKAVNLVALEVTMISGHHYPMYMVVNG